MFELSYDPSRILMSVVQQGYWSMPMFRQFEAEFLTLHNDVRKQHRNYRVIADCRDFAVQSPEIGQAFGTLFEKLMAENKGHYAILPQRRSTSCRPSARSPSPMCRLSRPWTKP